jgi:hypothetical protein
MADKKISELTPLTGANLADNDEFAVVDTSATETKAITFGELKTALDTSTGFVRITGDTMTGGLTVPTVDINGGTIDGTVIGGSTPAAISGTTGQFGTSLNVDGTITSDGLTVDGNADISGFAAIGDGFISGLTASTLNYQAQDHKFKNGANNKSFLTIDGGTGDISFYEDTGTTPKFFWDASAESLGIGTSSPLTILDVKNATNEHIVVSGSATYGNNAIVGVNDTGSEVGLGIAGNPLEFYTAATERMRITSAGNVGIGTVAPLRPLSAANAAADAQIFAGRTTTNGNLGNTAAGGGISFGSTSTSTGVGYEGARILMVASQAWTVGSAQGSHLVFQTTANSSTTLTERARIDESGNLLVGKTSVGSNNVGFQADPFGAFAATVNGGLTGVFNRQTSDGEIIQFRKDGTTVGSIGSDSGVVSYMVLDARSGGVGIKGTNLDNIVPVNAAGVNADAAKDLGLSTIRWRNLFLSGGVYLGGTGSANLLDDYEEGTFTPLLAFGGGSAGITYGQLNGVYVKTGKVVTVRWGVLLTNKGTDTGTAAITGLPFIVESLAYADATGATSFGGFSNLYESGMTSIADNGATTLRLVHFNTTGEVTANDGNFTNASYVYGTLTYTTTA